MQAVGSSARLPNEPEQRNQGRCDHFLHVSRTYPDFFAWVDTALSLRRRQHTLQLSVEHRAAAAPEALTLALLGDEQNMHLGIVGDQQQLQEPQPANLDATILDALQQAGDHGLTRASLRSTLHVRNERLGQALPRLAAAGQLAQRGDRWVAVPRILPIDTPRNGNGNLLFYADPELVPSARLT